MPRQIKQTVFGRRVRDAFFTQDPNYESLWVCFCKIERKPSGSGYSNLLSHVQNRHAAQLQDLRNAKIQMRRQEPSIMQLDLNQS